jgi:hypothetical protein
MVATKFVMMDTISSCESLNIYESDNDKDELQQGIVFKCFVFWVFRLMLWFHCSSFLGFNSNGEFLTFSCTLSICSKISINVVW